MAQASGTGFVVAVDHRKFIVTSNHVIWGADRILVSLDGVGEKEASLLGSDPLNDLAVLQTPSIGVSEPLLLGDDRNSVVGEPVLAFGYQAVPSKIVTSGILSGRGRVERSDGTGFDCIYTDAKTGPGSSGGPVVDLRGSVIGMVSAVAGASGGLSVLVPSRTLQQALKTILSASSKVSRP